MNETRSKNSKRNMLAGAISSFCTILIAFLTRTAVIYALGEHYVGLSGVFSSVTSVLNMAELGFSSAIIVNLYMPLERNDTKLVCAILNYYKKIYRAIGLVILVAGISVMPFLSFFVKERFSENVYIIYMAYLLDASMSYWFYSYKGALLNAVQRFDIVKKILIGTCILKGIMQMAAVVLAGNFYLYVAASVMATLVNNLLIQYISVKKYPCYFCEGDVGDGLKRNIRKQVTGLSVGKIAETARNSFDNIVLSLYLGLSVTAIYSNYFYVYSAALGIVWMLCGAVQASVGNSIVAEPIEKNYQDLRKIEMALGCVICVFSSLMLCLYQPFMDVWTGGRLLLPDKDMMLFVLYFYCMAINGGRNLYLQGLGLWWEARAYSFLEMAGNLLLNIWWGKLWGVTGILLATILTVATFNYACLSRLLFKHYFKASSKMFFIDRGGYTLATAAACAVPYVACRFIDVNGMGGLFAKAVVSSALAICVFSAFCVVFKRKLFGGTLRLMKFVLCG